MLSQISWSSFLLFLVLLFIIYYLYVLIAYFRKDIFSAGFRKHTSAIKISKPMNMVRSEGNKSSLSQSVSEVATDHSFTVIHELLEDLKELLVKASETKMVKEELLQGIRSKLKTYPGLKGTDLEEEIDTHIVMEAKEKCLLDISQEDLKQIWSL